MRRCRRTAPRLRVEQAGFTVIELIIVILIFSVVTSIALPAISRITTHSRVNQAALLVSHDLTVAASAAARQRRPIRITLGGDRQSFTLLSLVLVSVAQLSVALARRFYALSGGAARGAVVAQQVNQFTAMPFDWLNSKVGTITVNKPPLPYTRKVTVDSLSPKLRRVTIVITPLNSVFAPDTLVLQRSKPGNNPFKTP